MAWIFFEANEGEYMEAIEALALISGHVEEELLIRNEYLAAEYGQKKRYKSCAKY